jgi:hypothetical protein
LLALRDAAFERVDYQRRGALLADCLLQLARPGAADTAARHFATVALASRSRHSSNWSVLTASAAGLLQW